jgi:transcriptional regulator with XRE-family HTH domain
MPIGAKIGAWRLARGESVPALAARAGFTPSALEAIEAGDLDPSVTMVERLASALGLPPSWLFVEPEQADLLAAGDSEEPAPSAFDPVTERIVLAASRMPDLYVLLTARLQSGDGKLIRVAEVNLRSLIKQSKQAAVPWQSRPPGHFEPPSD